MMEEPPVAAPGDGSDAEAAAPGAGADGSDTERASLKEKKLRLSQRWEAVVKNSDVKSDERRRSSKLTVVNVAQRGVKEVASGFGTLGPPPRWLKPLVDSGAAEDEIIAALERHNSEVAATPQKQRDSEEEARGATWLAGLRSAALKDGRTEAVLDDVVVSVRRRRRGGSAPPGAGGRAAFEVPPRKPDFASAIASEATPPAAGADAAVAADAEAASPAPAPDAAAAAAVVADAEAPVPAVTPEAAPPPAPETQTPEELYGENLCDAWDDVAEASDEPWRPRHESFNEVDEDEADDEVSAYEDEEGSRPSTPPIPITDADLRSTPLPPADDTASPRGAARLFQCWVCGDFNFLKRNSPTPKKAARSPVELPDDSDASTVARHWT